MRKIKFDDIDVFVNAFGYAFLLLIISLLVLLAIVIIPPCLDSVGKVIAYIVLSLIFCVTICGVIAQVISGIRHLKWYYGKEEKNG